MKRFRLIMSHSAGEGGDDSGGLYNVQFRYPSSALVSGASMSGKSTLVCSILRRADDFFAHSIDMVLVFYQQWQGAYMHLERTLGNRVQFHKSLPTSEDLRGRIEILRREHGRHLGIAVVIDDYQTSLSREHEEILSVLVNHSNIFVFLLLHRLYSSTNSTLRALTSNAQYIIFCKNIRNKGEFSYFARQFQPGRGKWLVKVFEEATSLPFSHLLVDLTQTCPERIRLRANILDRDVVVYTH